MNDKKKLTSLLIIYTGGTIGMVRDPVTRILHPFPFDNIVDEIPELKKTGYQLSSFTFDPPLDSSNINPEVWVKIVAIIEENYHHFDGFVVLHGTDTMAYSASALSFMLENLGKPVIFTGSQLPIGSLRTDAKENLVTAIQIAAALKDCVPVVPEVTVFFQNRLYRGNRTTKHNAEEFKAFQSYNYPYLAETGVHVRFNYSEILSCNHCDDLITHKNLDSNVAILKLYPGISQKVASAMLNVEGLRGLVLETFGAGTAPNEPWFLEVIDKAVKRGMVILNVTQCAEGRVEMDMYETSIELEKRGVISGYDITTEAALTKLMYLLGRYSSNNEIIRDLNKSLRGEITV
ncbi:MAG: asparaginase [Bacteroidales bacterium]|nr:asparaginase [Bacteroidales bacterium]